jgi:DUF4097 and DUF4098 domain-containing protein YvlB
MISSANRRSRVLAAALPLLLVCGIAYAGHKLQREDRQTVDVDGQRALVIVNPRGKTIVVGEEGSDRVTVIANKWVKAGDEKAAQRIMDALEFEVDVSGETITVTAKLPESTRRNRSFWSVVKGGTQNAYIDFTVEVPHGFDVHTTAASGDVQVTNIGGTARIHATSGNVLLREIGGPTVVELTSGNVRADDLGDDIRVAASSGNAEIRRVKGLMSVHATSGNVGAYEVGGDAEVTLISGDLVLKGCLGDVQFSTSSGSAEIAEVLGGVNATTSSGALDVVIVPVGEKEFFLNTSSGNVVLHYLKAEDYGFLLDVNTCTGAIRGDLNLKQLDQISRRKLKGVVGNGKSRVIIETASGNVSIIERTERAEQR